MARSDNELEVSPLGIGLVYGSLIISVEAARRWFVVLMDGLWLILLGLEQHLVLHYSDALRLSSPPLEFGLPELVLLASMLLAAYSTSRSLHFARASAVLSGMGSGFRRSSAY